MLSNDQGSDAKDEQPVPYEMYMKHTNTEKNYMKNYKEMPESAECCLELIKTEGSDPEGNVPAEKVQGGSASRGSKKQGSKAQPTSKAKGNKHKSKGKFQRKKKFTSLQICC